MKKIFLQFIAIAGAAALSSCSFFEIDNYPGPEETVKGYVTDVATGEPVLTEQNSRGIRVRMLELSWDNSTYNPDFYARDNGFFQNTKIFKGNFLRICRDNSFCINHHDTNLVRLPLIAAVVILLFTWKAAIPIMLVALLFGVRYSFEGKDDLKEANAFMESAGNAAESLKEGFANAKQADKDNAGKE